MKTLKGYIRLARPVNALICGLAVVCGGIIGDKPLARLGEIASLISSYPGAPVSPWVFRTLSAAVSASLILAAGNAFNDVSDLHCDRINAPNRPLPSGLMTPAAATMYALLLALTGLSTALPLGIPGVTLALLAVVLLFAYDTKLKGVPLMGNVSVALLGGLAFVYGGIAGNAVGRSLIPALFALLFHLGRELVKDAADVRGDEASGIRTTATVWGKAATCKLASAVFIMLAVITAVPFATGYFGIVYLIIVVVGVWPVLLFAAIVPRTNLLENNLRNCAVLLKLAMPVGILAILAGFQGY